MDATEQAIDQTMRITLDGVEYALKISGAGVKNLLAAIWNAASTKKKTKGKARLAALLKSGKELKVFNIAESDLEMFTKEAKRYGVLYAVIKGVTKEEGARADIMVKAEDAAKLNRIVERLEYAHVDVADVVAEVEQELEGKAADKTEAGKAEAALNSQGTTDLVKAAAEADFINGRQEAPDAPDKGVAQKQEAAKVAEAKAAKPLQKEMAAFANPPLAKTARPAPSEPFLNERGQSSEASISSPAKKNSKTKGMEDATRERRSVRAQLDEIKRQRSENPRKPARPEQTKHQQPTQARRKNSKHKTPKGR